MIFSVLFKKTRGCAIMIVGGFMGLLDIKNLTFKYNDKEVFNDLNLYIRKGSFTTIFGNNNCGKTTLVKLIMGLENTQSIYFNNHPLNRKNRSKIGVVWQNPRPMFMGRTVYEELSFLCYSEKEVLEIASELNMVDILNTPINKLSEKEEYLVALATALIRKPEILIFDGTLAYFSSRYIKSLNKKGLTIINLTTNPDELLLGTYTIFLTAGKVFFRGGRQRLLNNLENLEKQFSMPFIIDLSEKLMFYDLIDKPYTSMQKLIDDLW